MMGRLFNRLIAVLADLSGWLIAFIALSVCLEVVTRYVFNYPLTWTIDTTEYLQIYIAFFAAAAVLQEKGHVKLDLVVNAAGPRIQKTLETLANFLGAVTAGAVFFFSARVVYRTFIMGTPVIKALEVPKWLVLIPIPFGCLLLTIEFMRRLIRVARGV
jgi:C4-dicarboxylate transporter, DctQ subunit